MKPCSQPARVELKDGDAITMMRRFETFIKALFAVPKKEIDQRLAAYQKGRRKKLRRA